MQRRLMHTLEDRVSAFLKPMIDGHSATLSEARRDALARWAIKTSIIFEHRGGRRQPADTPSRL